MSALVEWRGIDRPSVGRRALLALAMLPPDSPLTYRNASRYVRHALQPEQLELCACGQSCNTTHKHKGGN